jgi:5-methylcytosine-specific restriction endonuclease McrA
MEIKICKYDNCNSTLEGNHHQLKYCTEHQKMMRSNRKHNYNRVCEDCDVKFISKNGRTKKCEKCKEFIICNLCSKKVKRTSGYHKYCSKECSSQSKIEFYYNGNYNKVIERDGGKCIKCGSIHRLSVHHIDYSGFYLKREGVVNNEMENLILFCDSCHQQLHTLTNRTLVQNHLEETKEIMNNFIKDK